MSHTTIEARAKAFSGQGVRTHVFAVDDHDGVVRVWDPVAKHYTHNNELSESAIRRIRKLALAVK